MNLKQLHNRDAWELRKLTNEGFQSITGNICEKKSNILSQVMTYAKERSLQNHIPYRLIKTL